MFYFKMKIQVQSTLVSQPKKKNNNNNNNNKIKFQSTLLGSRQTLIRCQLRGLEPNTGVAHVIIIETEINRENQSEINHILDWAFRPINWTGL